jgi:hypothetical protein
MSILCHNYDKSKTALKNPSLPTGRQARRFPAVLPFRKKSLPRLRINLTENHDYNPGFLSRGSFKPS